MSVWQAKSAGDLNEISGVIHDAWFDIDDVAYDQAAGSLCIAFAQDWKQLPEAQARGDAPAAQLVRRTWRYTEEHVPFARGDLRIEHVVAVRTDEAMGDAGMLLGVSYDQSARRLIVEGVSGSLMASIKRLGVTAELHADQVAVYVRRRRGLLGGISDVPLWAPWPR